MISVPRNGPVRSVVKMGRAATSIGPAGNKRTPRAARAKVIPIKQQRIGAGKIMAQCVRNRGGGFFRQIKSLAKHNLPSRIDKQDKIQAQLRIGDRKSTRLNS